MQKKALHKTVLFFPLGNVLGHVTRTAALAEEFCLAGHRVYIAMKCKYPFIHQLILPKITILNTLDVPDTIADSFGYIYHYEEGMVNDRENIQYAQSRCNIDKPATLRRIHSMVKQDNDIIEALQPDIIVTDYRITAGFMSHTYGKKVFHISHILGYPSYHTRVMQEIPSPFTGGNVLVPGIKEIELWKRNKKSNKQTLCGLFRWKGWSRLTHPTPPKSDLFVFFGSTGNDKNLVPHLLTHIPNTYSISCISTTWGGKTFASNVSISSNGDLESFIPRAQIVFCHGGHGTVMEALLHKKPLVIIPKNIEQLEIGRRLEKMNLGVLVKKPYHALSTRDLTFIIHSVLNNHKMHHNLCKYSRLLKSRVNGTQNAMKHIFRKVSN